MPKPLQISEDDKKERLRLYGYDMSPGEIGCFLSHRALWKSVEQSNLPTLVLEDDFLVTHKSIKEILYQVTGISKQYDIIRFQTTFENKNHALASVADLSLVSYFKSKQGGTIAYFIHPRAAKRLYQKTHRFYMSVNFIDSKWAHHVLIYGFYPSPITFSGETSEIEETQKPPMSLLRKI